jgi:hypothetical protein
MIAIYALWCGLCWVLRGGYYGNIHRYLFGREPGTTITRIACAFLMAAPLAILFDPALAVLWLSIYAAMTIGYFKGSMGLERPEHYFWLALWGATVSFIATLPTFFLYPAPIVAHLGALAVLAYAVNKPFGRRFGTDWTERAEFLTGVAMGAALFLATKGI